MGMTQIASLLQALFGLILAVGVGLLCGAATGDVALGVGAGMLVGGGFGVLYAVAMERRAG